MLQSLFCFQCIAVGVGHIGFGWAGGTFFHMHIAIMELKYGTSISRKLLLLEVVHE